MKKIISAFMILFCLPLLARENCEQKATQAASYLSKKINKDRRVLTQVRTLENTSRQQVVEVIFDQAEEGAHVGYTVTVERNPSPTEKNQYCSRVLKIELTSEE